MSDIRTDQIDLISGKTQAEMREERIHQLTEIQKVYGDNLPYDRDRIVNEVKFIMSQTAEGMLQMGRRLIILKERESHGGFIKILENDLSIPPRSAQRMMQASIKFLSLKSSNASALAHLGKAKLFDLMSQDDEELEALAEGGTVAGLTLDEMDKMTTRELKKALKEAKEDQDAVRKISSDKDKKINELAEKLEKAEAKKKKEVEKIKLEESETDRLIKSYKITLADITAEILANSTRLQQLYTKAVDEAMPEGFFLEMAHQLLNVREGLDMIAEQLPSDVGVIDTGWLDEDINA